MSLGYAVRQRLMRVIARHQIQLVAKLADDCVETVKKVHGSRSTSL
jgi:hypothetical protein